MAYQYFSCKVSDIVQEAPDVRRFWIEYPDDVKLNFRPGQFIMFDLPIEGKITNRSYSIASAPADDNRLELIIVLNREGKGTPFLFYDLQIGDFISCSLPLGKFALPAVIEHDLCFICTGTGVAPFRSMIHHIYRENIKHQRIFLIMGARKQTDLYYRLEFEKLQNYHPDFHFHPVLSREEAPVWMGHQGYVHGVYQNLFPLPGSTQFYLCGWSAMIQEAREKLLNCVFEKSQIHFEKYD